MISDNWRNYPPDGVYHPVIYDTARRLRYIVAGQTYNHARGRRMLIVYAKGSDFYEFMHGVYDYEQQKVYTANKHMKQLDEGERMNFLQRENFNTHWLYRFIEEGVYLRDKDDLPLMEITKENNNQLTMDL